MIWNTISNWLASNTSITGLEPFSQQKKSQTSITHLHRNIYLWSIWDQLNKPHAVEDVTNQIQIMWDQAYS